MIEPSEIASETRRCIPSMAGAEIRVEPINKGGSDRSYARLNSGDHSPLIFMAYTDARPDNAAFLDVSEFLMGAGVNVPKIVAKDLPKKIPVD